jgi:hypothetical protein
VSGARGVRGSVALGSLGLGGVLVIALALVLGLRSGPAGAGGASPRSSFSLEQARAFDEFPLFSPGRIVDGHPLTAVLRRDDRASYVSFVYGDCTAERDTGCAPPVEVQTWPLCRRSLALYEGGAAPGGTRPDWVLVRGVPGVFFDQGTRLELETGRSLVVVFASSREQAQRIADELEAVDGSITAGSPLPPPAAGRGKGGAIDC